MHSRVAIVTTLRNTGRAVLDSFIRYHVQLGFAHLYLFFDDPEDDAIPSAGRHTAVSVIRNDERLRERWRSTRCFALRGHDLSPKHGVVDGDLVMLRQQMNVEIAVQLGLEQRMDWLLHIDADELFYCARQPIAQHFQSLVDRGIACVSYCNHEAVPEKVDMEDFFREATLFKRNRDAWPEVKLDPRQRALFRSASQLDKGFFRFYANGKSAARLSPDLSARGVHDFSIPEGARRTRENEDPVILHYPCCGFQHFWNKYRTLGRFADLWDNQHSIRDAIGSFHLESRDIVMQGVPAAARAFYERRMVLQDHQVIDCLIDAGLALRIDGPANMLRGQAVTSM